MDEVHFGNTKQTNTELFVAVPKVDHAFDPIRVPLLNDQRLFKICLLNYYLIIA